MSRMVLSRCVGGWWTEAVSSSAEVAAAHRQHGSGDVGRFVGCEKEDRRHLLVDRSVAVHQAGGYRLVDHALVPGGLLATGLGVGLVARNASLRGIGAAGRGGIDSNAVSRVLHR